jgi:hypothetical protein
MSTIMTWAKDTAIDFVSTAEEVEARARQPVEFCGYKFTAPESLFDAAVPRKPGLFIVQVRRWWWSTRVFAPIYVGQDESLREGLMCHGAGGIVRWLMEPRAVRGLFLSTLVTPLMNARLRAELQARIMQRYLANRDIMFQDLVRQPAA